MSEDPQSKSLPRFARTATKVLLVEDNEEDTVLFTRWLGDQYRVVRVTHLTEAIPLLHGGTGDFDVIVADLGLPDAKGLAVLARLRDTGTSAPIVALTSNDDEILATQAVELGIQDYMVKDRGSAEEIRRVIRFAMARKKAQSQLIYHALHDSLTGLGNRALFDDRLEQALRRTVRRHGRLGVMHLNLDRFKTVNDTWGPSAGDVVLQQSATRIQKVVRESDSVVRMGADEFTIILEELAQGEEAHRLLEKLLVTLSDPFTVRDVQFAISSSIGVAFFPEDGETVKALQRSSKTAMKDAKRAGGNSWRLYQETGV